MTHPIRIARVYDPPDPSDGARLLIDRLWPRGLAKATLRLDDWPVAVTPSADLRRWFHADRTRWPEFVTRYRAELDAAPDGVSACLGWCRKGPVTLLTAAQEVERCHATVLRDYLAERLAD
ncbi:MAG: DUF488 family protein [Paracoccaceae bacterium]|nr:DUF488 family protein [Paracoccaceae bacterium]